MVYSMCVVHPDGCEMSVGWTTLNARHSTPHHTKPKECCSAEKASEFSQVFSTVNATDFLLTFVGVTASFQFPITV